MSYCVLSESQSASCEGAQQWGMASTSCPLHREVALLETRMPRSGRKLEGEVGGVQSIPEEMRL